MSVWSGVSTFSIISTNTLCDLFVMKTCCQYAYLNPVVFLHCICMRSFCHEYLLPVCIPQWGCIRTLHMYASITSIHFLFCCILYCMCMKSCNSSTQSVSTPFILYCYAVLICIPVSGCILTLHMYANIISVPILSVCRSISLSLVLCH